jgi:hypothetical protein
MSSLYPRRPGLLVSLPALLLVTSACGVDDGEALGDLDRLAEDVMATGEEIVDGLEDAGVEVNRARGEGDYCQMEPAPGLTFTFGAEMAESAPYAEVYADVVEVLQAQGWEVTDAGEYARPSGQPEPYARLARDNFTVSIENTVRQGSDALVLGLHQADDCIRVSDGSVQLPEELEEDLLVEQ